jgi:hypothetical protein
LQAKLLENSAWLGASPSNIAGKLILRSINNNLHEVEVWEEVTSYKLRE